MANKTIFLSLKKEENILVEDKAMETSYAISSGPSREDLFDSLRLAGEERKVRFVIQTDAKSKLELRVQILGIEIDERISRFPDQDQDIWKVTLFVFDEKDRDWKDFPCYRPIAYYSTKTRQGVLMMTPPW